VPAIIEVSGPSAVGKTTLIGALAPVIGAVVVPEVLQGTSYRLPNPSSAADFLRNQLWLLDRVSEVYLKARRTDASPPAREPQAGQGGAAGDSVTGLIDSGVADILSFAKHFPPTRGVRPSRRASRPSTPAAGRTPRPPGATTTKTSCSFPTRKPTSAGWPTSTPARSSLSMSRLAARRSCVRPSPPSVAGRTGRTGREGDRGHRGSPGGRPGPARHVGVAKSASPDKVV